MQQQHHYVLKDVGFTPDEIRGMAELHTSEIEAGFLTSLGVKPLRSLYEFAAKDQASALIAAFGNSNPEPLGLIWGTADCSALYRRFLKQKGLRALAVFLPRLISWTRMKKAFETLLYPTRSENARLPRAEILNFAVRPAYRGTGLAEELFRRLINRFKLKGETQVKIVTGATQVRAQRFYEKMGAKKVGPTTVHKGQLCFVYIYEVR